MTLPPQWIIEKKRDGIALSNDEISMFIDGFSKGHIPDYQMAALAMAIYFQGMTSQETAALADAMLRSGAVLNWSEIPGPKVDKHSTGGVGDKISLVLAPLAAACGLVVPMMSGRGLGITGGTLDKLESVPGFRVNLEEPEIRAVLHELGCCMFGQTKAIVPADRMLYALRDVTATVPSIPLIAASIMSKKMAEGIDALVLDVKWGSGAFMKTIDEARSLADALMRVGRQAGLKITALITDMNQPLGYAAGNALEVMEVCDVLRGAGPDDVRNLSVELCGHMLALGGLASDPGAGKEKAASVLQSGAGLEKFRHMLASQGGDQDVIDEPARLGYSNLREPIIAETDGYIASVDADAIGRACVVLGAGRSKASDAIDHVVGISDLCKIGYQVRKGQVLALLHANNSNAMAAALPIATAAFQINSNPPEQRLLVAEVLHSDD